VKIRWQWPPMFETHFKFGIGFNFGKWEKVIYWGVLRIEKPWKPKF
jgi:hypothetical protein